VKKRCPRCGAVCSPDALGGGCLDACWDGAGRPDRPAARKGRQTKGRYAPRLWRRRSPALRTTSATTGSRGRLAAAAWGSSTGAPVEPESSRGAQDDPGQSAECSDFARRLRIEAIRCVIEREPERPSRLDRACHAISKRSASSACRRSRVAATLRGGAGRGPRSLARRQAHPRTARRLVEQVSLWCRRKPAQASLAGLSCWRWRRVTGVCGSPNRPDSALRESQERARRAGRLSHRGAKASLVREGNAAPDWRRWPRCCDSSPPTARWPTGSGGVDAPELAAAGLRPISIRSTCSTRVQPRRPAHCDGCFDTWVGSGTPRRAAPSAVRSSKTARSSRTGRNSPTARRA